MKDLTSGHEGKAIFYFALPMLIGSLFQQLYNTADSIIVGQFVGTDAMAAVSGASPIMFLLTSLLMGITLGFSILVSQYYGSRDMKCVKATIDTTYIFIGVGSLVITLIGLFASGPLLHMMNTPANIIPLAQEYLIIIFIGTLFSAGYNGISAILRGLGDSKNPLIFLIIATVLNIILDVIFVIAFDMGIAGVALATVIAQGVSFIFSVVYLNKRHAILKVDLRHLVYDRHIFLKGMELGIPSAIQQMLFSLGNIALQSLVNGYGTYAMAAFGAGTKIESFISIPIMNLGAAVSTFVAQNMGAGQYERIKKGVRASIKMSILLAAVVASLFVVFSEELISLFNTTPEVVEIGASYLLAIGPAFIIISTSFMWTSAVRGAGASIFSLISSLISLWLVRIPASYLLSSFMGIKGVWLGIPIGWIVGWFVVYIYYRRGTWQTKGVTAQPLTATEEA
ncbi:MAG: MATE family efflux transporter [Cellulosilyticaceae bacterium]